MPDDLRSRIELAARLAGTPRCGEPLLREVLAAGGLGFVTRETLADAGVPRSLRSAVLEALTDSDDSRTARARLQKQVEGLPRALRAAVEHVLRQSEAAVRAERAVFVLGAILRHAAAALLGPLLSHPDEATSALRLLARPTYGQLWAATRQLAEHPRLLTNPLALCVIRLDRERAPVTLGEGPVVSRLLALRNSIAHGSRALEPHEWRAREPGLLHGLALLLERLPLRGAEIMDDRLTDEVGGEVGVLEGWDDSKRSLHFVGSQSDWYNDTSGRWEAWRLVIEAAGIAKLDPQRLQMAHIESRARASLPAWCAAASDLPLSREQFLGDDAVTSGALVHLNARDPSLVVAALVQERAPFPESPVLVLSGAASGSAPALALSDALGLSPGLAESDLPEPAMKALCKLHVVVLDAPLEALRRWSTLCEYLPGIRVWLVRRSEAEDALPELGHLAPVLYERIRARHPGRSPRWENLSSGARQGRWTVARAWAFASRPALLPSKRATPVEARLHALTNALSELGPGRAAELLADAQLTGTVPETSELVEALAPLELLRMEPHGASFDDDDTAFAVQLYVLQHGTQRIVRAVVGRAEAAVEPAGARLRQKVLEQRGWTLKARILEVERCAVGALDGSVSLDGVGGEDALEAAALLGRWRRPREAGSLLAALAQTSPAHAERAARLARTCADVATAERLLSSLAPEPAITHQLAGVLRDRNEPGDAQRAAELYQSLLAREDLAFEQRVWTLCGDAENRVRLRDRDGAIARLSEARELARRTCPGLLVVVDHREAFLHADAREFKEALPPSTHAIEALGVREDAFAARVLDTHARILEGLDDTSGALESATRSLRIKRRVADRRGIQMTLLLLSRLRQVRSMGDAVTPAREALLLAESAGDPRGLRDAHRRLASALHQSDPRAAAEHRSRANELHAGTSPGRTP